MASQAPASGDEELVIWTMVLSGADPESGSVSSAEPEQPAMNETLVISSVQRADGMTTSCEGVRGGESCGSALVELLALPVGDRHQFSTMTEHDAGSPRA
jgi:hypothetical protein